MKIFLNDRIIRFVNVLPVNTLPSDMVTEYLSGEQLRNSWEEFMRYEKYRNFIIYEPETPTGETLRAVDVFKTFFKVVQAAGGLVKNEKGEYLFIHRLGFWDLPKGKIEKKDIPGAGHSKTDLLSARAAAIREVQEETGVGKVLVTQELSSTWHIYIEKNTPILKQTRWFAMEADSGQSLKPQVSEGIFLVKWTKPEALHCILSHTYASLRELLVEVVF
jgi:8-oxo-dGTP pyrophosphatase MutT (NUDIX family)